jgi:hypothetical protein
MHGRNQTIAHQRKAAKARARPHAIWSIVCSRGASRRLVAQFGSRPGAPCTRSRLGARCLLFNTFVSISTSWCDNPPVDAPPPDWGWVQRRSQLGRPMRRRNKGAIRERAERNVNTIATFTVLEAMRTDGVNTSFFPRRARSTARPSLFRVTGLTKN